MKKQVLPGEKTPSHHYPDMNFLGCLLAVVLEFCFFDEIFVPDGGGASFGALVLIIINMVAIPAVMLLMTAINAFIHVPRQRVSRIIMCAIAFILTILSLFIAYPVGR